MPKPKLKTYIVPVEFPCVFGGEVEVEATSAKEAARIAIKDDSLAPVGGGMDWNRCDWLPRRLGTWDRVKVSPTLTCDTGECDTCQRSGVEVARTENGKTVCTDCD
jgi:hypothetical protein